ncbi:unnamed protein product [Clavelina lepadiformis]|uniref:Uncharacterized protein n=1 Tax=Clavelina lepadiformis TaxID=159417 RepID=A0ABP0GS44_CLALP
MNGSGSFIFALFFHARPCSFVNIVIYSIHDKGFCLEIRQILKATLAEKWFRKLSESIESGNTTLKSALVDEYDSFRARQTANSSTGITTCHYRRNSNRVRVYFFYLSSGIYGTEKFYAIALPFKYKWQSKRSVYFGIAIIWMLTATAPSLSMSI